MMKKTLLFLAALLMLCGTLCAQEKVRDQKDKTQYSSVLDLLRNEPGVTVSPGGGDGVMPKMTCAPSLTTSSITASTFCAP